jgi:hypothetical protein
LYNDTNGVAFDSAGFITLKTDSKLKYSGKFYVEGKKVSFKGVFDLGGVGATSYKKLVGRKSVTGESYKLTPVLDPAAGTVSGTINKEALTTFYGEMEAYKALGTMPSPFAGQYTAILPGSVTAGEPAGHGSLLVELTADKGQIKSKGYLSDGEKVKPVKPVVGQNGEWPFYAAQYKDGSAIYHGAVIGWLQFTNNGVETNVVSDQGLAWFKPLTAGGPPPALVGLPTAAYTNYAVSVVGSFFTPVLAGQVINITTGLVTMASVDLTGGPVATNFWYDPATSKIVFTKANNPNSIKLSISGKSGELKGSFLAAPPDKTSKRKIAGAVLQNANVARGLFPPGPIQSGTASGTVEVQAAP